MAVADTMSSDDSGPRMLSFAAVRLFSGGAGANVMAVGDLDKNGLTDVVTGSYAPGNLYVLLNAGGGNLQQPVSYVSQARVGALAVGDFNKDGAADVVTGNIDLNMNDFMLSMFLSKGDGTLQARKDYDATPAAQITGISLGDFNRDGNLDASVVSQQGGVLQVMLGSANGSLMPGGGFVGGLPIISGDWNNDGKLDLAFIGAGNTLYLDPGDGAGKFAVDMNSLQPTPAVFTGGMVTTDANRDGKPDIAGVDVGGNRVVLLLGPAFNQITGLPLPQNSVSIDSADFDGDGVRDLAVVSGNVNGGIVSVLLAVGDGTFKQPLTFPVDPIESAIVAADMNADGRPDIVTLSGQAKVGVLLNTTN
jgi:FG-GAP-like repeat